MRIFYLLLITILASCSNFHLSEVEEALHYAGENRPELEKALAHYSRNQGDSLKLRAAEFLIANMPGHWSYNTDMLSEYYSKIDTLLTHDFVGNARSQMIEQLNRISQQFPDRHKKTVEDIRIITADYLIQNIDKAFDAWEKFPWAGHLSFDDFCEYLLPYKVTDGQPFDSWRDTMQNRFGEKIKYARNYQYSINSVTPVAVNVRNEMKRQMKPQILTYTGIPLLSDSNMLKLPAGNCKDYAVAVLAAMRSNGIPVAIDFTPQWAYRAGNHSWNSIKDGLRNNIIFEELNGVAPGNVLRPYSKLGKVYRETYAINREWLKLRKEKNTPALFRNIFLKDVTAEYSPVADLKIDILPLKERKNAVPYLALFDNREWVPVALGAVEDRKALFKDMCKNTVYFPMYHTENGQEMLNYPFLPEYSGNIRYFVPDTARRRTVVLHRKYPVFTRTFDAMTKIIGSKIQAASKEDFLDSITVHSIDTWQSSGSIRLNDSVPSYRYWRFYSPDRGDSNIAELMFFRQNDTAPLTGRIIGTDKLYKNDTIYSREKAFDNNPLTYFHAATPDCSWVGLDFGEPVKIERVIYFPRNDGNNIRLGDEYELFYWSEKGWTSLGQQEAKDTSVKFTGVPDNALLWLHNRTEGVEERIFTYENEKQVWW